MTEPFLSLRGISKSFAGVKALDSVDFDIYPGEVHCLAGENGSGKSTMIKVISGVYDPDAGGEIVMGGTSYAKLTPIEAINNGVQVIYQDFSIFPNLTVAENLALTGEVSNGRKLVNWKRMRAIAEQAVAKINFKVDLDARVGDLSVADKQLVAISRALITEPKLLIMDEPTTALTHREVEALFRVVADLQSRGIAILFVSHKLEEVFEISERFTIIRNGRVVVTTLPEELDHKKFAEYMTGRDYDDSSTAPPVNWGGCARSQRPRPDGRLRGRQLHPAPRRGARHHRPARLGPHRARAHTVRCVPQRPGADQRGRQGRETEGDPRRARRGIAYVPEDRLTEGLMLERSIADNIVISELDDLSRGGCSSGRGAPPRCRAGSTS
ncbi:ATP-binding cassette domain-containing protein [Tessaracoccus coleopterorum]|nr:sugar ABC transporter ATP-binding protein [Tessaracoccus coleopterorum]